MRTNFRRTPGLFVMGMIAGLFSVVQPAVSQDVTGVPKDTTSIEKPGDQTAEAAIEAVNIEAASEEVMISDERARRSEPDDTSVNTVDETDTSVTTVDEADTSVTKVDETDTSVTTVDETDTSVTTVDEPDTSVTSVDEPDTSVTTVDEVMERLSAQLPGILFTDVVESSVSGLFEVTTGGQIYYVDETAQYLVDGSLIRLSDRTNLTDARLGRIHMGLIDEMDEEDMLVYPAKNVGEENQPGRSITVFTDISCGFCRRLHAEIDTLLEEGVSVRYLLFPRAGMGSQGHKDLESVWCADNPQEAMTIAKAGGQIEPKTCENPIESHVALAESVGLRGTPLIYTDGGEKVPGYREASTLVTMVNASEPMDAVAESDQ